jgi:hypothetical protein
MSTPAARFKQIDVERVIKGALKADIVVYEVIASKDGIHLITHPSGARKRSAVNEWDEVYEDGAQE